MTTVSYSYSTDGKFLLLQENYANDDTIRYTYNEITAMYSLMETKSITGTQADILKILQTEIMSIVILMTKMV